MRHGWTPFCTILQRRVRSICGGGGCSQEGGRVEKLPAWVTITVILALLAMLAYNMIVYGPEGYPLSVILGGLLGAYAGLRELLNRRNSDGDK